jgi:hypothetical protein
MLLTTRLAAGVLCLAAASVALACGYHGDIGEHFGVLHSDSLVVAVAMRKAADRGVIEIESLDAPASKPALLYKQAQLSDAMLRLYALKAALASPTREKGPPLGFSIVLVESGLWSRLRVGDGGAQIEVHTDAARDGEITVLTGKPVLARLLAGTLSLESALAEDLVVIDGSGAEQREAVRRALSTALNPKGSLGARVPVANRPSHDVHNYDGSI